MWSCCIAEVQVESCASATTAAPGIVSQSSLASKELNLDAPNDRFCFEVSDALVQRYTGGR